MTMNDEQLAERLQHLADKLPVTDAAPGDLVTRASSRRVRRARVRSAGMMMIGAAVVATGVSTALALRSNEPNHLHEAEQPASVLSVGERGATVDLPPEWTIANDPCTAQGNYAFYATREYMSTRCPFIEDKPANSSPSQIGVYMYQDGYVQDLRATLVETMNVDGVQVLWSDYMCDAQTLDCHTTLAIPSSNVLFDIFVSGAQAEDVSRSIVESLEISDETKS